MSYILKIHVFFSSTVKYMREATPYVKKGSPVSEIGWETPPPESPRLGSSPITSSFDPLSSPTQPSLSLYGDRRCIPLKMCYVTRAMTIPDPDNRYWRHTHTINCWATFPLSLTFYFHTQLVIFLLFNHRLASSSPENYMPSGLLFLFTFALPGTTLKLCIGQMALGLAVSLSFA